jgi:hypothetical protein
MYLVSTARGIDRGREKVFGDVPIEPPAKTSERATHPIEAVRERSALEHPNPVNAVPPGVHLCGRAAEDRAQVFTDGRGARADAVVELQAASDVVGAETEPLEDDRRAMTSVDVLAGLLDGDASNAFPSMGCPGLDVPVGAFLAPATLG